MEIIQCRMARAALGWSADDLAEATRRAGKGVSVRTIRKFELQDSVSDDSVALMRQAFEREGILFIEHGVYVGGVVPTADGR